MERPPNVSTLHMGSHGLQRDDTDDTDTDDDAEEDNDIPIIPFRRESK